MPNDSISALPVFDDADNGSVIARMSHKHEQIVNWLLQNPEKSLRECADTFNYSQGWLSQLIHSDIFQAQLKGRQEAVFVQVAQDIPTKLKGLADIAIEKVTRIISETEEPAIVIDVFDKTLNRLGYAPQKNSASAPAATQVNMLMVSKDALAEARLMIGGTAQSLPAPVNGGDNVLPSQGSADGADFAYATPVPAKD